MTRGASIRRATGTAASSTRWGARARPRLPRRPVPAVHVALRRRRRGSRHRRRGHGASPCGRCRRAGAPNASGARRCSRTFPRAICSSARWSRRGSSTSCAAVRGKSVIAGYPWFGDWGRDTFISVRGLCLATGSFDVARARSSSRGPTVSEGMLPNRFADHGEQPGVQLRWTQRWFVVAARELLDAAAASGRPLPVAEVRRWRAIEAILEGYERRTRHRIGLDASDAAVRRRTRRPAHVDGREGRRLGGHAARRQAGRDPGAVARGAACGGCAQRPLGAAARARPRQLRAPLLERERELPLHDVVDPDGHAGAADASFRPNQILAVGGLPLQLLGGERARGGGRCGIQTWTPLRTALARAGRAGIRRDVSRGPRARRLVSPGNGVAVAPGPFVEARVRVRGGTPEARQEARARFPSPLEAHLADAGIGHVSGDRRRGRCHTSLRVARSRRGPSRRRCVSWLRFSRSPSVAPPLSVRRPAVHLGPPAHRHRSVGRIGSSSLGVLVSRAPRSRSLNSRSHRAFRR